MPIGWLEYTLIVCGFLDLSTGRSFCFVLYLWIFWEFAWLSVEGQTCHYFSVYRHFYRAVLHANSKRAYLCLELNTKDILWTPLNICYLFILLI